MKYSPGYGLFQEGMEMPQIRQWDAAIVAAAGTLSNTFGSSAPATDNWLPAAGCIGVKVKATAISLPTATELRVTIKFKDGSDTETWAQFADGTPSYQVITAINRETEVFWDVDADYVGIEPWLDAADAAATCSLSIKRISAKT